MRGHPDWRLLQVFLSPLRGDSPWVYEVYARPTDHALACTCPGFRLRRYCRHIDFVIERMVTNGGDYTTWATGDISAPPAAPEEFRAWMYRHTRVEMLDQGGAVLAAPGS